MWGLRRKKRIDHESEDKNKTKKTYILEPFPQKGFDPLGWIDILATLYNCGYGWIESHIFFVMQMLGDSLPLKMVRILSILKEVSNFKEKTH